MSHLQHGVVAGNLFASGDVLAETGLEHWVDAVAGKFGPSASEMLRTEPSYAEVLRAGTRDSLALYDSQPDVNGVFMDVGSFSLGVLALYLDAVGGITHRRLAELSGTSTILSRGRASAVLALMQFRNLVHKSPVRSAGGQIRYHPDKKLTRHFRARFRIELDALSIIEPALKPLLARWDEPGVFPSFVGLLGTELVRAGTMPPPDVDIFNQVGARRAGMLILFAIMHAADNGGDYPSVAPFELSVSATARRFRVSRSQVLRVLRDLTNAGLIELDGSQGGGRILPTMQQKFPRYGSISHSALLLCAHGALRRLDQKALELAG